MPFIDGSQAQKHVTHNEALRILDAAIQIGVLDLTLTAPPASPAEGERHVVASGATGAWAGHDDAIASWQDGAWTFLAPKTGWCIWSVADDYMFVFDGTEWRDMRSLPSALDNALRVGVNTAASSPNLFSVKSNAALFAAIDAADGGTGDMRLQVSKEGSSDTASVFFSENFSGRAEFGLIGSDTFKLKVSPDGTAWTEAFNIDQDTGNLTLPRGLSLAGVIAPAQITADQADYSPAGLAAASVLQISADAARSLSGLDGGAEGRCVVIINVGSQPLALIDEGAASVAANRFSLGRNLTIGAKQAAILRYDGTAARWQAIAGGAGGSALAIPGHLTGLTLSTAGSSSSFGITAGLATDSTGTDMMSLAAAFAKTTGAWAAGTGNGALDTGSIASDTWYHVFLIKRPDTGAVDVLISASAVSPTLPASYTLSRRIGSMRTDGSSNWTKFSQYGDEFLWDLRVTDLSSTATSSSTSNITLSVPTGLQLNALTSVRLDYSAAATSMLLTSPSESDQAATSAAQSLTVTSTVTPATMQANIRTDTSSRIRSRSSGSGATMIVSTYGWIDRRGRDG
jgi:hypothetical protein